MATVPDTTVTKEALAPRLNLPADDSELDRIFTMTVDLVGDAFAGAWRDVPEWAVDECVYRVARALRDGIKKASTGAGQVSATETAPLRAPADPLVSAYPIIRRYVVMGL